MFDRTNLINDDKNKTPRAFVKLNFVAGMSGIRQRKMTTMMANDGEGKWSWDEDSEEFVQGKNSERKGKVCWRNTLVDGMINVDDAECNGDHKDKDEKEKKRRTIFLGVDSSDNKKEKNTTTVNSHLNL